MSVRLSVVLVLVTAGCALAVFTRSPQVSSASPMAACGAERWTVKTLGDRPALLATRLVTVRYLVTRPAPTSLPDTRLSLERHVFTVVAQATLIRPEEDGDFHVVLDDGPWHMIAEAPSASCTAGAKPALRRAMAAARGQVQVCSRAKVTGVAFFDFRHGQTGVAPNAIELHPILGFRCLTP